MFLTVPDTIRGMEPNEAQRRDLGDRVTSARIERYGGSRKDAYNAAGVNAATWTKVEEGRPLAERSLVAIVKLLWPETGGNWVLIDPPLGGDSGDLILDEVRDSNLSAPTKEYVTHAVRSYRSGQGQQRRRA